ncbi:SLC13 family permease [Glutamicibacter arilaitensis]|uniref:SLC13 family permease n=1 Tax=Glutamicibacter arilaitensis TaxID=256701 RepID=UPI003FD05ABF
MKDSPSPAGWSTDCRWLSFPPICAPSWCCGCSPARRTAQNRWRWASSGCSSIRRCRSRARSRWGQSRAALLVSAVVVLWCTEPLHQLHPAIVALLGSLLVASPGYGSVGLAKALKAVPWSMLIFMAATLTLGTALAGSGAAEWLARKVLGPVEQLGAAAPWVFTVLVVVVSATAHLVIQSRSARSAVLIPLVVSLAPGVGVNAVAIALASTAAAGFCHTLTSSSKPVNLFSEIEGIETYKPADLLRLSAVLGPLMVLLVLVFAFWIWPAMGLPLFL